MGMAVAIFASALPGAIAFFLFVLIRFVYPRTGATKAANALTRAAAAGRPSTRRSPDKKCRDEQADDGEASPDQAGLLEEHLFARRIVATAEFVEAVAPSPIAIVVGKAEQQAPTPKAARRRDGLLASCRQPTARTGWARRAKIQINAPNPDCPSRHCIAICDATRDAMATAPHGKSVGEGAIQTSPGAVCGLASADIAFNAAAIGLATQPFGNNPIAATP